MSGLGPIAKAFRLVSEDHSLGGMVPVRVPEPITRAVSEDNTESCDGMVPVNGFAKSPRNIKSDSTSSSAGINPVTSSSASLIIKSKRSTKPFGLQVGVWFKLLPQPHSLVGCVHPSYALRVDDSKIQGHTTQLPRQNVVPNGRRRPLTPRCMDRLLSSRLQRQCGSMRSLFLDYGIGSTQPGLL